MSDSILGIPLPGSPQGDPEQLRSAATGWRHAADELSGAVADAQLGLDQLDWEGAGATAFHEAVAALAGNGKDASQHFGDFATGLQHAADTIDTAQTAYKASLGVAATAIAVGGALTIFTLGASDAAAAAVVAGSAAEMGGVVATLDLTMMGIDASIEITVQALLRVLFSVIGQFATNLISQETSYALTHGGLTGNLQYGEAAVFSAGALIPGVGGVGGYLVAAGTGAGLDAAGEFLDTGTVNLDTLLISAGAAGLFHAGGKGFGALRGRSPGAGGAAPSEAAGGAAEEASLSAAFPEAGTVPGAWGQWPAGAGEADALEPTGTAVLDWGSPTDVASSLSQVMPPERYAACVREVENMKLENPALAGVPTDDLVALRDYTKFGAEEVNPAMRVGVAGQRLQVYVDHMVAGLERMPTVEGTVYREVVETPSAVLDTYQPGHVVTESGFTSTDLVASNSTDTQFVIHSVTGRDVQSISHFGPDHEYPEREVLFKPGTRFEVLDRVTHGAVTTIVMQEIP